MEGSAGPGEDYADVFENDGWLFAVLLVSASGLGLGSYLWRWESVLTS